MKVNEIMTTPVETISPDASITSAAEIMKSCDVGILPVQKKSRIIGMITDRDIVLRVIAPKLNPQTTSVNEIMTTDIICCHEDTDIQDAARMIEDRQVHRLLVLDRSDKVAGILSVGDIARKSSDEHMLHEVLERVCEPAPLY